MCQSNAYLVKDSSEELIMEDVILMKPENGKLLLIGLFGERKLIDAEFKMIDLFENKIVLEKTEMSNVALFPSEKPRLSHSKE